MSDTIESDEAQALLARLQADLAPLRALDLTSRPAEQVLALTVGLERFVRTVPALEHQLVAELESRGTAAERGCRTTAKLLTQALRLHPGEAGARVKAAASLGPGRSLTGQALEPVYAATALAQAAGDISVEHARVIVRTVEKLPVSLAAEHEVAVEELLVQLAADVNPGVLAQQAHRVLEFLDPDGIEPRDEDHRRQRSLRLSVNTDGSGTLRGHLTPAGLAVMKAWLEPLSAPKPAEDGTRDPRSASQRAHDALEDAGIRLLTDGGLPATGGTPATLVLTMTQDQFDTNTGSARSGHGVLVSAPEVRRLTDQAEIVSIVFDAQGGVASFGREKRSASLGQRIVLGARDGGCCFTGCDEPADRCQAHHIRAWQDGGTTDLENLGLLCGWHHRVFEKLGFTCQMIDGIPHWTAPPWLDPGQTPKRNTAHQLATV